MKQRFYRGVVHAGRLMSLSRRTVYSEPGSLRVLMYHRVSAEPAPLVVSPESFAEQQAVLARRYRVVSLEQVLEHVRGVSSLPPGAVLITFDDGYRDNLTVAKPILDAHGHSATIFVPTDFIGSDRPLPHDRYRANPPSTLSWGELQLLASTFSVGSHGCSHRVMTALSRGEMQDELVQSKHILEEKLGRTVNAFSYPWGSIGDFNNHTQTMTGAAGYELVFTTLPGINRASFDQRRIRRHNVEDFGIDYFEALLDGSAALLALKDSHAGYWAKKRLKQLLGAS